MEIKRETTTLAEPPEWYKGKAIIGEMLNIDALKMLRADEQTAVCKRIIDNCFIANFRNCWLIAHDGTPRPMPLSLCVTSNHLDFGSMERLRLLLTKYANELDLPKTATYSSVSYWSVKDILLAVKARYPELDKLGDFKYFL